MPSFMVAACPPLQWFEDADPEVVAVCKAAVTTLERLGLEVRGLLG